MLPTSSRNDPAFDQCHSLAVIDLRSRRETQFQHHYGGCDKPSNSQLTNRISHRVVQLQQLIANVINQVKLYLQTGGKRVMHVVP
jgi:hypothetical protein